MYILPIFTTFTIIFSLLAWEIPPGLSGLLTTSLVPLWSIFYSIVQMAFLQHKSEFDILPLTTVVTF